MQLHPAVSAGHAFCISCTSERSTDNRPEKELSTRGHSAACPFDHFRFIILERQSLFSSSSSDNFPSLLKYGQQDTVLLEFDLWINNPSPERSFHALGPSTNCQCGRNVNHVSIKWWKISPWQSWPSMHTCAAFRSSFIWMYSGNSFLNVGSLRFVSRDCAAKRRLSCLLVLMAPVVSMSSYMKLMRPVRIVPTLLQRNASQLRSVLVRCLDVVC